MTKNYEVWELKFITFTGWKLTYQNKIKFTLLR